MPEPICSECPTPDECRRLYHECPLRWRSAPPTCEYEDANLAERLVKLGQTADEPIVRHRFCPPMGDCPTPDECDAAHACQASRFQDALRSTDGRDTILEEAQHLIYGPRADAYGNAADEAAKVAAGWSVITGAPISPEMYPLCMAWLKIVRQTNKASRDNLVDLAGYAGVAEKIERGEV